MNSDKCTQSCKPISTIKIQDISIPQSSLRPICSHFPPPIPDPKNHRFTFHEFNFSVSMKVKVAQSCLTLCSPMDCSLPGSSVHASIILYKWSPTMRLPWWLRSKESTASTRDSGSIPESGRPLEKEMATHSSVLAWEIPWTEEPGRVIIHGAA